MYSAKKEMGSTDDSYSHTGPKEREARKIFRKVRVFFLKMAFALIIQKRVLAVIVISTEAEARTKKERARKVLINLALQPRKAPRREK